MTDGKLLGGLIGISVREDVCSFQTEDSNKDQRRIGLRSIFHLS